MLFAKYFSLIFIIFSFLACGVKKPPIAPQISEEKILEMDKLSKKNKQSKKPKQNNENKSITPN